MCPTETFPWGTCFLLWDSRTVLRWKKAFPQCEEAEHEHQGHEHGRQGHAKEEDSDYPLRQGASREGELRPVGETVAQNGKGGEEEGVDRPQPQEPPVQGHARGLVPRRQPGKVGEELEVEVDIRH